jgi:putative peptidoglycan lipid II flippase
MNLGKAVFTIGGWTILSRVTGLVRDSLMASYLGAGLIADAFAVAFRFPNMFRALFAEGAFNAAFVPLFTGKLEGEGQEAARHFAEQVYAVLGVLVLGVVIVMEIAMPWAIYGLAWGFSSEPGKIELAAEFSRITFPYLLFITMVSLQSGVLNAMGRFAAAAGTPVLLNITSVAVLLALTPYVPTAGHAMAWGVFASGISQFLWLLFSMKKAGMSLRWVRPSFTPEVKTLLKRVVPGAVGAGVYQVNVVLNTVIASGVAQGAVSYLYYAERLNQLPLGIVGIAIGTALLPSLSRQLRAGDIVAATDSQNRAMELGLLLTLPAAFAFAVIAQPIIALLYEHRSFHAEDTIQVARTLTAFSLGLPAYVLIKVVTPSFFARHDTTTPVKAALVSMVLNIALNLLLMRSLQQVGMALATAAAAWVNFGILVWRLKRLDHFTMDSRLKSRIVRILGACVAMSAVLWGAQTVLAPLWTENWYARLLVVILLIGIGGGVYGIAALLLKAVVPAELRGMLRRRKAG